ncbi:MAG: hypothetical protein JW953_24375 [Anaerolineae bacterium]|nr:hypothetical protein [Anaerolineae bacterium]
MGVTTILGLVWYLEKERIPVGASNYSPLYSTQVYYLFGQARLTQEFKARYPGLDRVELYLTADGPVEGEGQVVFRLKDSCTAGEDLETITVPYASIVNGRRPYPFTFLPIDDSAGRSYCLILETLSLDYPTRLGVYASGVNVYPPGKARYEPDPLKRATSFKANYFIWLPLIQKNGSLAQADFDIGFRLHYNGLALDTLQALLAHLSAHKPCLFGLPCFYILLLVIYLIALAVFWTLVFKITGPKL